MKKVLLLLFALLGFTSAFTFAAGQFFHGEATGANATLNFDDSNTSTVQVLIDQFKGNVCGTNYSGFLVTGYVDTQSEGYLYFNEPDGNDDVNSCSAIIISGDQFILTGQGYIDGGDMAYFDNIKLIYNSADKVYYFSGKATTDAIGTINHWDNVYVSGLNLIDWNNTIVDASECTGASYYANGNACKIKIALKDVAGNPVYTLSSIDVKISGLTNSYLSTGADLEKTFSVTDGIFTIPLYVLKAINNGTVTIDFSYDLPDMDGNKSHTINISGINIKSPLNTETYSLINAPIVGNIVSGSLAENFVSGGNISSYSFDGDILSNDSTYSLASYQISNTGFNLKYVPNNPNQTLSKVSVNLNLTGITLHFNDFGGKDISYSLNKIFTINLFADKRPDLSKSFTGFVVSQIYTGADLVNTLQIKPVLRDSHGYVIPDVKFSLKLKDAGSADSFESWDCNEFDAGYQDGCKDLQFLFNGKNYSGTIDGVNGGIVDYATLNNYIYNPIKVVSYKPVSGAKLYFDLSNLENTSSDWNFPNSGNWISTNYEKTGYISNIQFKPYFYIGIAGIGDQNYVDVNNNLAIFLKNVSNYSLNSSFYLTGVITQPTTGVSFSTGEIIESPFINIDPNTKIDNFQKVLFDISFNYNGPIKFNYNNGYYYLSVTDAGVGQMKLKPWKMWFGSLKAIYQLAGTYVNGLVSQIKKYSTSVKTYLGKNNSLVDISFAGIYNKLNRKVTRLISDKLPETNYNIDPDSLNGGSHYYNCDNANTFVDILTGTYHGNNLIAIKNCKVLIKGNIYKGDKNSTLTIFVNGKVIPLTDGNYFNESSNIYIAGNVSDIEANLITNGSIVSIPGLDTSFDKFYLSNRQSIINAKQLYIYGTVIARNNIGGGILTDGKITIGTNRKIDSHNFAISTWSNWTKPGGTQFNSFDDLLNLAQIFDLNFARGIKYQASTNQPVEAWYSEYCKNHISEAGCKYPVYIKYDPSIRQNILFK